MLLLAREQGEDLFALKKSPDCPHGQFKARVDRETCLSYETASGYMRVAKIVKNATWNLTSPSGFCGPNMVNQLMHLAEPSYDSPRIGARDLTLPRSLRIDWRDIRELD